MTDGQNRPLHARIARQLCRWWLPWGIIAALIAPRLIPTSYWFEAHSVVIADTIEGRSPSMVLKRSIHRPFSAIWSVTVRLLNGGDGERSSTIVCSSTGSIAYKLEARVPPDATLDWWTLPVKCNLKPGQYIVTALWTISLPWMPDREMALESNPFRVFPASDAKLIGAL